MKVEKIVRRMTRGMGEFSSLFIESAVKQGAQVDIIAKPSLFRIKKGGKGGIFFGIRTPLNKLSSSAIADNKELTKKAWQAAGMPAAKGAVLKKGDFKKQIRELKLDFPLVVKPAANTLKGAGIVTNIGTKSELSRICAKYFSGHDSSLLVETYYGGREDFRILILKGRVIGALKRIRAYVEGNGRDTVKELIEKKNAVRKKQGKAGIVIDGELRKKLKEAKMALNKTPAKGRRIQLKNVCNAAVGGEVEEITDQIHEKNRQIAAKAAEAVGLDFAGLDVLCTDLTRPLKKGEYVFLEINKQPDLGLHHRPEFGKPNPVADEVVKEVLKLEI